MASQVADNGGPGTWPRRLRVVGTIAIMVIAVAGIGKVQVSRRNDALERRALESAGLAPIPATATEHKVMTKGTFLHDVVSVFFADSRTAIEAWKGASTHLAGTRSEAMPSGRYDTYQFTSPGNNGVTVTIDPKKGLVSFTVFLPKEGAE